MGKRKGAGGGLTVKKRLFWSNILMIVVPVVSAVIIGLVCIGFIWEFLLDRAGIGIKDQNEFDLVCMAVAEVIEHGMERGTDFSSVESLMDNNGMAVKIVSEGESIYEYGRGHVNDDMLLSAASVLGGKSTIAIDDRCLFVDTERLKNMDYTIYLFGNYYGRETYSKLKASLLLSFVVIMFGTLLSVLLANRFLTKFVFKRIEEPLDILSGGVREIRDGNLEYRIAYSRKDEFLPVCEDFNEMAVRLKQSVDMMQRQEKSRRELLAGISHDLRSPLTSIQAYVEGLLDGVAQTKEVQERYLETIRQKAEDLAHIISQLFLFSKIELGEYPENPCILPLDEKIAETVSALQEEYRQQGLEIHMELAPVEVSADPVWLHRILVNILENSLKYKQDEKGNIWICLRKTPEGCQLSLADDGPGVPEEALSHLFEVFYRSDPARQNPSRGSGLGLAIVANAVQRMGGRIKALANEPKGLVICIDFVGRQES